METSKRIITVETKGKIFKITIEEKYDIVEGEYRDVYKVTHNGRVDIFQIGYWNLEQVITEMESRR